MWAWVYYFFVRVVGTFLGKWKTKGKFKDLQIVKCSWIEKAYIETLDIYRANSKKPRFSDIIEQYKNVTTSP